MWTTKEQVEFLNELGDLWSTTKTLTKPRGKIYIDALQYVPPEKALEAVRTLAVSEKFLPLPAKIKWQLGVMREERKLTTGHDEIIKQIQKARLEVTESGEWHYYYAEQQTSFVVESDGLSHKGAMTPWSQFPVEALNTILHGMTWDPDGKVKGLVPYRRTTKADYLARVMSGEIEYTDPEERERAIETLTAGSSALVKSLEEVAPKKTNEPYEQGDLF